MSSCFSPPLRLFIAILNIYNTSASRTTHYLLPSTDFRHGLLSAYRNILPVFPQLQTADHPAATHMQVVLRPAKLLRALQPCICRVPVWMGQQASDLGH